MKKVLVLCATLALGGCITSRDLIPTPSDSSTKAKQIQSYVKIGCGVIPTIGTISAILGQASWVGVAQVGEEICTAITTMPLAEGPNKPKPMVRGVVIRLVR